LTIPDGLRVERAGDTLIVTADRGDDNLFSGEMIDALADAVDRAAQDGLRFAWLRAEGPVFCVGRDRAGKTALDLRSEAARIVRVNETLRTTPLTVIAEVQGHAAGFGAGLVASADIAVAAESAQFWFPEIAGGLAPSIVISWLSKTVPYKSAFDLVATGRRVDAHEARALGLVTDVALHDSLHAAIEARLEALRAMSPGAIKEIKEFFVRVRGLDPANSALVSVEALALSAVRNKAERQSPDTDVASAREL
jgi:methylglutaconyl-CoA hydratase